LSEARNKIVLQPAADDAAKFARHLPGVTADDLMGLEPLGHGGGATTLRH
jgi:hypothetical protein